MAAEAGPWDDYAATAPAPGPADDGPWTDYSTPAEPQSAPATLSSAPGNTDTQAAPVAAPETPAGQTDTPKPLVPADVFKARLTKMLSNPRLSKADIAAQVAAAGYVLPDDAQAALDQREEYITRHGRAPVMMGAVKSADEGSAAQVEDPGAFNAFARGAADGVTLGFGDEIAGAVGATSNSLTNLVSGDNGESWSNGYTRIRDDQRNRNDTARELHGTAFLGGQLLGGAALPMGEGATLGRLALEGAAYGAAYGLGSGQGSIADQAKSTVEGAAIGGGAGAVAGYAARALARLKPTETAAQGREVLDAAHNLSRDGLTVRPLPADVGGAVSRRSTGVANQGIVSGAIIQKAGNRYVDSVTQAATRAADSLRPGSAAASSLEDAATAVAGPQGLGGIRDAGRAAADTAYGHAAQLAGDTRVVTPQTLDALDQHIVRLDAIPGGVPGLDKLRTLRDDLANGSHTVDTLRQLRTSFGDNFDASNRTARTVARDLWGHLSQDITNGLTAQGKQAAADAYRTADRQYAAHLDTLNGVVKPVLGKTTDLSDQQVAGRLLSQLRTNAQGFTRALDNLSPDLAGNTRGAIFKELGRDGDNFSVSKFARAWSKLGDQSRDALVPLGTQAREDVEDVLRLAQGVKDKGRFNNHSNTAGAVHALHLATKLASGYAGWLSLGKTVAGEAVAGTLLSSHRVAKGIVALGEKRPIAATALKSLNQLPREQGAVNNALDQDE